MKTVELKYLPGDECYIHGQYRTCYIESVSITKNDKGNTEITYMWYNLDAGPELTEVWDDGYFETEAIGKTVFDTYEELVKAFPADYAFEETD